MTGVTGLGISCSSSRVLRQQPLPSSNFLRGFCCLFSNEKGYGSITFSSFQRHFCKRLSFSLSTQQGTHSSILKPIAAARSGLDVAVKDPVDISLTFKNAEVVIESQDSDKIQLRVDLTGEETQKAFDVVLRSFARQAPPIPGFRREKGGKTSKVPKAFLLEMLGEERVTKFVVREIVTSTVADFVKKEQLTVSDKITTTQEEEQLCELFSPGNAFGFNVVLEPENTVAKTTDEDSES